MAGSSLYPLTENVDGLRNDLSNYHFSCWGGETPHSPHVFSWRSSSWKFNFLKFWHKIHGFFFWGNTFGRAEIIWKNVRKKATFCVFFTLLKHFSPKFCHDSFLGRFARAEECKKWTFIFLNFGTSSQLSWENTGTDFWDTP